ncbi:MAG: PilZ domain-containing protein [Desulfobulbaceae bacterium]|nr:PilZ domain-containing protein [Desulfobulbaceae bacterium]
MKNINELKVTIEETPDKEISTGEERRTHKRYRVKEGALALIDNSPGTIVDISTGGLTVNYIVFGNEPSNAMRLDIFLSSEDFYLQDVPAKVVNSYAKDKAIDADNIIQVKRYGLQFGELTKHQEETIKYFILHNTVAEG